ncbi:hypothetical protein [Secundilactobacillus kimchicus]|nr:hypothetical protein [Secundilactobacillus kimchicus]
MMKQLLTIFLVVATIVLLGSYLVEKRWQEAVGVLIILAWLAVYRQRRS